MGVEKRSWGKEEGRREEEGWTGMSLEVMADKRNAGSEIDGYGFDPVTEHELSIALGKRHLYIALARDGRCKIGLAPWWSPSLPARADEA